MRCSSLAAVKPPPLFASIGLFAIAWVATAATEISDGPMLGQVTDSSIVVWARTASPGRFVVRHGTTADNLPSTSAPVTTSFGHDLTGSVRITGLKPETR